MKTPHIAFTFFSLFMLSSFTADPDSITITGHLKVKSKKNAPSIEGLYICAKEGDNLVGETETDENGNFTLDFERQEGGKKPVSVFYVNEKSDTVLLKKFAHFSSETPELTFNIE
ncbi:MAG: hypothetical protein JSS82_02880 [Bacteroidetes bacterium]|nr:hypothetical protein [Bacteroidota bacterium]